MRSKSSRRWISLSLLAAITVGCSNSKKDPMKNDDEKAPPVVVPESALKGIARTNADSPNPTAAQLTRKAKNEARVRELGLPINPGLPVVEDDLAVKPRSAVEVAQRTISVMICAVKGEANDQELTDKLVSDYGAAAWFSPEEDRFLKNLNASPEDLSKFGWRYEALHVFLWALSYSDSINPPNEIADAGHDVRLVKVQKKDFIAKAHLRSQAEILDMADLYYRLDWAAVSLRVKGQHNAAIDGEIVMERHRALNWLIRYMNQSWDDVKTDT